MLAKTLVPKLTSIYGLLYLEYSLPSSNSALNPKLRASSEAARSWRAGVGPVPAAVVSGLDASLRRSRLSFSTSAFRSAISFVCESFIRSILSAIARSALFSTLCLGRMVGGRSEDKVAMFSTSCRGRLDCERFGDEFVKARFKGLDLLSKGSGSGAISEKTR